MAQGKKPSTNSVSATLWSLLIIAFMVLVIGHLVDAIGGEVEREGDLIERTFTSGR